jgi:hypothetical protein
MGTAPKGVNSLQRSRAYIILHLARGSHDATADPKAHWRFEHE